MEPTILKIKRRREDGMHAFRAESQKVPVIALRVSSTQSAAFRQPEINSMPAIP